MIGREPGPPCSLQVACLRLYQRGWMPCLSTGLALVESLAEGLGDLPLLVDHAAHLVEPVDQLRDRLDESLHSRGMNNC